MSIAQTILHLELGRFLCGLGAGVSVVVVPLYLNEISPVAQRGQFGFMSQLAINLGILLAQTCGLFFSDYGDWRYIFAIGAGLAALNAILVLATPESPKWLATAGHLRAGRRCLEYLRDSNKVDHEFESYIKPQRGTEEETLFTVTECDDENNNDADPEAAAGLPSRGTKPVSIWKFGTARRFRRQLVSVIGLMAFQQICGVNSIVFYSVEVLAGLLPRLAPVLNCIISAITCVIVIASASIVDKHGRKVLLLASMAGMAATAASLGYGMGVASATLTAVSATAFVASFALGLGPVPFMMVPELVASDAANAAQSIGMAVNWFSQFLVVSIIGHWWPRR